MLAKGELSLSELQKIAGEIRSSFPDYRGNSRLGHLEIAALLFRLKPARVVWSSSFSRTALCKLYREIGDCDADPILQRPDDALGFSAGLAFAALPQDSEKHVCCCMSDLDQLLGGVWEAAIRAVKLSLGNLFVFVVDTADDSGLVADRYAACGWNVHFMNAEDIAEGFKLLTGSKAKEVPSVIISRAVADEAVSTTVPAFSRMDTDNAPEHKTFQEVMNGLFRGIAAIPGGAGKVIFLVRTQGASEGLPGQYEQSGLAPVVDCGPAGALARSLALGFRKAGGTPFVAHRGCRGFSLSGCSRGSSASVKGRQVVYPVSALEAETAVLRLWKHGGPWQIRIIKH